MLYKHTKVFIASIFVIVAFPCFAADIASNATTAQCVEPTLHRYEGTANLQAEWEANTVQLSWYSNYTKINPTDDIDDCTYASGLTRPENPLRVGYTFKGWTVSPKVEFSTLSLGNATAISYGKGVSTDGSYCWYYDTADYYGYEVCNMTEFTDLQQFEWKQSFTNGTVYGMAYCSAVSGNHHEYTWPAENISDYTASLTELDAISGEKKYCWCQATGYKATNQSTIQRPLSSLSWVFDYGVPGSETNCAKGCATNCARHVRLGGAFRTALFAPAN